MVRTKNAGEKNDARGRREIELPTKERGKGPAVRGEPSNLPSNAQRLLDEAITKGKIFIADRGIPRVPAGYRHHWFSDEVARLGWITFCEPREPAVIPVVREFYAKVPNHKDGKIRLRGRTVKFEADTINRLFELPVPKLDEYEEFAGSELTDEKAEAVRNVLTNGHGRWATHNGEYVLLKRNNL